MRLHYWQFTHAEVAMKRTLSTALVVLSFGVALSPMAAADAYDRSYNRSATQEQHQPYPKQHLHHKRHHKYGRDFGVRVHHRRHRSHHNDRWFDRRHQRSWEPVYVKRQLRFSDIKYDLKDRDFRRIKKIGYEDGCYFVRARDRYGDKVRLTVDAYTGRIVDKRYR